MNAVFTQYSNKMRGHAREYHKISVKSCVVFSMLKMLQACTIAIVHVEELPTQIHSSCVEAVPSRLATISVVYERENVCVFLLLHAQCTQFLEGASL